MECQSVKFSRHAIEQMFARSITVADVENVICDGEIIEEYPNDTPYPSVLIIKFVSGRPVHVVVAKDSDIAQCIIITAYEPKKGIWDSEFKRRSQI